MPGKKYIVGLTDNEKRELLELISKGKTGVRKIARAHILLLTDEGKADREIAEFLHLGTATAERIRKRFAEGGPERAINEDPRPGGRKILNGREEAVLIAEACADPPNGRRKWTMQLPADRAVELGLTESISDETIRLILKKTR
jgi:transposase